MPSDGEIKTFLCFVYMMAHTKYFADIVWIIAYQVEASYICYEHISKFVVAPSQVKPKSKHQKLWPSHKIWSADDQENGS